MTDNEIIKALECCSNETASTCKGCPLVGTQKHCTPIVSKNALDLINRQKTEIESLKVANEKMYQANKEQESEIERLEDLLDSAITSEENCVSNIPYERAEAIKAYENKILELFPCDKIFTTISRFDVKDIAKEMTEEQ